MKSKIMSKYCEMPVQGKASIWFLACGFIQRGLSILVTPIFTRLMSTDEYGQFGVFNSWYVLLSALVTMNLSSGVYMQGLVKYEDDKDKFTSSLQGLTLTLILIFGAVYYIFNSYFYRIFKLSLLQMTCMFTMMWSSAVYSFWSVTQRVSYSYKKLVIFTVVSTIFISVASIIAVINSDDKVNARIISIAIMQLLLYGGLFFCQILNGKSFYLKKYWRYALRFNIPLIPHYLSQSVLSHVDRIMIKNLIGDSEAGIYNLAYSLSMIMTIFNTALMQTIEPWIYKKIKNHKEEDIPSIAYPTFAFVAIVNLALIIFVPEIVIIFAPPSYKDSIWIIPSVTMSVYFMFMYTYFAAFEFYYEKTKFIAAATMIGAIANIILNYVFLKLFGYYAAGYTTLVCYAMYALAHYCFMKKVLAENNIKKRIFNSKIILGLSVTFVIIGFVIMFTYKYYILRYSFLLVTLILILINRKKVVSLLKLFLNIKLDKGGQP